MVAERVAFTDNGGITYMQAGQGVFIAIEGSDGSGKGTQYDLLKDRLLDNGYDVAVFDFPQYDQPSSFFVREYLQGTYGSADQVGPYTASLFYALDRYQVASRIRQALDDGKIVLANRFVGSSMAHQGTKFHHAEERRGYFIWLDNLEFEMLRIPRPTMSFVLRVPAEVSYKLIQERAHRDRSGTAKPLDLHEASLDHLARAVDVYDDMCQLFPKDFTKIDCMKAGKLQTINAVEKLVWDHLQPFLPPARKHKQGTLTTMTPPKVTPRAVKKVAAAAAAVKPKATSKPTFGYYTPETLSADMQKAYKQSIDQLLRHYADMVKALTTYLEHNMPAPAKAGETAQSKAYETLRAVLPVALAPLDELTEQRTDSSAVAQLAREILPETYVPAQESVQLTEIWPRNELDIVADMLYEHSNLPLAALRTTVATLPYASKLSVFDTYLAEQPTDTLKHGEALKKVRYGWDIVSDYGAFHDIQLQSIVHDSSWQPLTPRYGYEVPALIDDAGLTDIFEACFDISLQLHSKLQAAGYMQEAQYATLYGHRMRWKVSHSAVAAIGLFQQLAYPSHPSYRILLGKMLEVLQSTHPVLAESLVPEA